MSGLFIEFCLIARDLIAITFFTATLLIVAGLLVAVHMGAIQ